MEIDLGWAVYYEVWHFVLSAIVGLLAYLLILTILSRITYFKEQVGVFSTHRFSLFLALCFAFSAHILEDYILGWF